MNQVIKILSVIISFALIGSCISQKNVKETGQKIRPNIIYILADDLGYGDLSLTGQEKFSTPNIDKLARDGMFFTQHYSGAAICAPSRSA